LLVDVDALEGEVICGLRDQIRRADSEVAIVWCPTEIGIPTFTAVIWAKQPGIGLYKGYGCHLNPEIAMVRAVTEAAQARTIFVAGARDDLLRGSHAALRRSDVGVPSAFAKHSVTVDVGDIQDRSTKTFHGDIGIMINALHDSGFPHVLAREFEMGQEFEVAVTRVVVPGLEPYRFPWISVTERAKSFVPVLGRNSSQ
jgi:ribosomal protein S12 methylthiotransferase accessory factor